MTASPAIAQIGIGQPRARGQVRVSSKLRDGRSVLDALHQSGSMKTLFPKAGARHLEAVLLNTAGGVTGGDQFDVSVAAQAETHMVLTTQAAERAYRAQPRETGRIRNRLTVEPGARLDWLPQETILFDGAAIDRRLTAEIHDAAQLLIVEPVVFGRLAMGETLRSGAFRDRVDIRRDGKLIFSDRTALNSPISAHLARPTIAAGAGAMATIVYAAPDADLKLNAIREHLPNAGGASLIRKGLLISRLLAPDSFTLRKFLLPIIDTLSSTPLPRTWTI